MFCPFSISSLAKFPRYFLALDLVLCFGTPFLLLILLYFPSCLVNTFNLFSYYSYKIHSGGGIIVPKFYFFHIIFLLKNILGFLTNIHGSATFMDMLPLVKLSNNPGITTRFKL